MTAVLWNILYSI
jgi:hypothetical protein